MKTNTFHSLNVLADFWRAKHKQYIVIYLTFMYLGFYLVLRDIFHGESEKEKCDQSNKCVKN